MTRRTKALAIPTRVKEIVWERDGGRCISCGNPAAAPNAHFVSRAQGGLGIEENIITLCLSCHHAFDFGPLCERETIGEIARVHLQSHYPEWDEERLVYKK